MYSEYVTMLESGTTELPLYLQNKITQEPLNITQVPDYYTLNAKYFSDALNKSQPFFLYHAFDETHHPQFRSIRYFNTSQRGMFGDALSEMDYNVGVVMDYLVMFSADNGSTLTRTETGGNAGLLKCGKGTTCEGCVRVPGIMWMSTYIESRRVTRRLGSTLDVVTSWYLGIWIEWVKQETKDRKSQKTCSIGD